MTISSTVFFLEMRDPSQLRPARRPKGELRLDQARIPSPRLNEWFYRSVGETWQWVDRLSWSKERWRAYCARPSLETWVLYVSGTPAGYFELEKQAEGDVEIAIFGLLPEFLGGGLGGWMLTRAVEIAWEGGAGRVWLHTCTEDHEAALPNYQKRGFELYDTKRA